MHYTFWPATAGPLQPEATGPHIEIQYHGRANSPTGTVHRFADVSCEVMKLGIRVMACLGITRRVGRRRARDDA